MLDRYVVFTSHAQSRLKEWRIPLAKANWLVYSGMEEKLDKTLKRSKVGDSAIHIRNGTVIFTMKPIQDKNTGDDIYLVLTVYDQRMKLGARRLVSIG